jgi:hypothetical protein
MPLTAQINASIPPQSFEAARDQLVAVLTVELANQYALDNTYPKVEKVWAERFITFDSDTELPAVNVNLWKGEYGNETVKKADGEYIFNIDIYTSAPSSDANGPGDQYAMVTMNKIAGIIRAILSNPIYVILDMQGIIQRTRVQRFFVGDKSTVKDALSDVVGRMQYSVLCRETVDIIPAAVSLEQATTAVKMSTSDKGFFYDYTIP